MAMKLCPGKPATVVAGEPLFRGLQVLVVGVRHKDAKFATASVEIGEEYRILFGSEYARVRRRRFPVAHLQPNCRWNRDNEAVRLFGPSAWKRVVWLPCPLSQGDCCGVVHDCENPAKRRILIMIDGKVFEVNACREHANRNGKVLPVPSAIR